jgi:CRISPR-associated protein Cas2
VTTRLYLVAYDVTEPRRLRRVHLYLSQRAVALQYSVFVLEAAPEAALEVRNGLAERIDPEEDDVRIYALPANVEVVTLGQAAPLPRGALLAGVADPFLCPGEDTVAATRHPPEPPDPPEYAREDGMRNDR